MYKKLILIISLLFIFSIPCYADSTPIITATIDHVEYDSNHNYIAVTKDFDSGEWCLNIFQSDKYNQPVADQLASILDGKKVTIEYDNESPNPDDWYVTDWKINNITGGQN